MRVLVTGSRHWTNKAAIRDAMKNIHEEHEGPHTLIVGDCPTGADRMAKEIAYWLRWEVEEYIANWEQFGHAAGPRRNRQMVKAKPDICLAAPLPDSKGTRNCIFQAKRAGVPVTVIKP